MIDMLDMEQPGAYYHHRRESISRYVGAGRNRVLDVGCASGNFGMYLKTNNLASEVVGIEVQEDIAKEASQKLDRVYCSNLNQVTVSDLFNGNDGGLFDYIICADVLEHLIDPWSVLAQLSSYLKQDGKIIISIPNVRHWSVWMPLVFQGRWEYREEGILDRTHLRFFTEKNLRQLIEVAGINAIEFQPQIGGKWKLLDKCTFGLIREFLAIQWVAICVNKKVSSKS